MELREHTYYHCKTMEEADKFFDMLEEQGVYDDYFYQPCSRQEYNENTCYSFLTFEDGLEVLHDSIDSVPIDRIVEFSDVLKWLKSEEEEKDIKPNVFYRCRTMQESNLFFELLEEKHIHKDFFDNISNRQFYGENTCYRYSCDDSNKINDIWFSSSKNIDMNQKLYYIEFSDVLKNLGIKIDKPLDDLRLGEEVMNNKNQIHKVVQIVRINSLDHASINYMLDDERYYKRNELTKLGEYLASVTDRAGNTKNFNADTIDDLISNIKKGVK